MGCFAAIRVSSNKEPLNQLPFKDQIRSRQVRYLYNGCALAAVRCTFRVKQVRIEAETHSEQRHCRLLHADSPLQQWVSRQMSKLTVIPVSVRLSSRCCVSQCLLTACSDLPRRHALRSNRGAVTLAESKMCSCASRMSCITLLLATGNLLSRNGFHCWMSVPAKRVAALTDRGLLPAALQTRDLSVGIWRGRLAGTCDTNGTFSQLR